MALIGTLRTKMTKWVVGAVALAMGAFIVGSDLFGNGPNSFFGNSNTVGEIAGNEISLEEYQNAIREQELNYISNFGRQPGEREMVSLRQQAWDLLIARNAIVPQYEKVGVEVTADEGWDMIQGRNIDEGVRNSFMDSAGNFDRTRLIQYLQNVVPNNPQAKAQWDLFRSNLIAGRARLKYENLLTKTNYVTEAEAEKEYHVQNDVAEVKYLYVPYFAVSDSMVTVSDADLKAYYEDNKKRYKTEEIREVNYVAFPVVASAADTAALRQDMEEIAEDFKTAENDSLFAFNNTDGTTPYAKFTPNTLPAQLTLATDLSEGQVFGPFIDNGNYKVMKLVSIGTDTVYNARASHILIRWDNTTDEAKKAAKEKARGILKDIKAGADFAAKAREFGTDGTASRGGDLGWFQSGAMVKPFEDAVFGATKTGVLNDVVETDFGYHIIDVTGLKDNTAYTIATVERPITPSDETQNEAYRKADAFANDLSGVEDFKKRAAEQQLLVQEANNLTSTDNRINNLGEARSLIMWLFRDAETGKVSSVFDLEDNYVVAVMSGITEEGFQPLADVKDQITPKVRDQQKGKILVEKINAQKGTLDEIAQAIGPDAKVASSSDLKLNTNSIPTVGFDPVAVGTAFALESGKRSAPFAGENGVLVIELQNKTIAPAIADYSVYKTQVKQNLDSRAAFSIMEALKEGSDIKDKRFRFY